jgi:hypothetical protein
VVLQLSTKLLLPEDDFWLADVNELMAGLDAARQGTAIPAAISVRSNAHSLVELRRESS